VLERQRSRTLAARAVPLAARVVSAMMLLAFAACSTPPLSGTATAGLAPPAGAAHWVIDPAASRIWLQLRADGPLARLGHTHVIVAQQLQGHVWLHPQLERSLVEVNIPVAALLVDDAGERARAGGDFAEPLDDAARSGTREHMLGDRQLDAAHYPSITLRSRALHVAGDITTIEFQVQLKDHQSLLSVPLKWQQGGRELRASGALVFNQTDLGLEPYSVALGALRVADSIAARFEIVARP